MAHPTIVDIAVMQDMINEHYDADNNEYEFYAIDGNKLYLGSRTQHMTSGYVETYEEQYKLKNAWDINWYEITDGQSEFKGTYHLAYVKKFDRMSPDKICMRGLESFHGIKPAIHNTIKDNKNVTLRFNGHELECGWNQAYNRAIYYLAEHEPDELKFQCFNKFINNSPLYFTWFIDDSLQGLHLVNWLEDKNGKQGWMYTHMFYNTFNMPPTFEVNSQFDNESYNMDMPQNMTHHELMQYAEKLYEDYHNNNYKWMEINGRTYHPPVYRGYHAPGIIERLELLTSSPQDWRAKIHALAVSNLSKEHPLHNQGEEKIMDQPTTTPVNTPTDTSGGDKSKVVYAHVKVNKKYIRHYEHTDKKGKTWQMARVTMPQYMSIDTMTNIEGYKTDVFLTDKHMQALTDKDVTHLTLSFNTSKPITLYKRTDDGIHRVATENVWEFVKSLKTSQEMAEYIANALQNPAESEPTAHTSTQGDTNHDPWAVDSTPTEQEVDYQQYLPDDATSDKTVPAMKDKDSVQSELLRVHENLQHTQGGFLA